MTTRFTSNDSRAEAFDENEFDDEYPPYEMGSKEKYLLLRQYNKYTSTTKVTNDELQSLCANGYLTILKRLFIELRVQDTHPLTADMTKTMESCIAPKQNRVALCQFMSRQLGCNWGEFFLYECALQRNWQLFKYAVSQSSCITAMSSVQISGLITNFLQCGCFQVINWSYLHQPLLLNEMVKVRRIPDKYVSTIPLHLRWWRQRLCDAQIEEQQTWSDLLLGTVLDYKEINIRQTKELLATALQDLLHPQIITYHLLGKV
jgi:hypothetical protein